jgi:hypothetical protein
MLMLTLSAMKALPWIAVIVLAVIAALIFRYQVVEVQTSSGERTATMDRWTGRVELAHVPTPPTDPPAIPATAPPTRLEGVWMRDSDSSVYRFLDSKQGVWGNNAKFKVTYKPEQKSFLLDWGQEIGWTNTLWYGEDRETLEGYTQHGDKFILKRIQYAEATPAPTIAPARDQ